MSVSRTILACRDTLVAGFVDRAAASQSIPVSDPRWWDARRDMLNLLGRQELPTGKLRVSIPPGDLVVPIEAESIETLHARAVRLAWADGAWDIRVLRHPPLAGTELGVVSANRRWLDEIEAAADASAPRPSLQRWLTDAACQGRLVTWTWLPMHGGPELRRVAHAAKDATLCADGSRDGAPPDISGIDWSRHGGCDVTIGLGRWSDEHLPAARPPRFGGEARATGAQRSYIVALRRRLGRSGEPLPAALTRAQASAIIAGLVPPVSL